MIAKATTKLRYVLLDANIIIEAYVLGIWAKLLNRTKIIVPSIVALDEALFYSREKGGIPKPIDLPRLVDRGKIEQVTAAQSEMMAIHTHFDRVFIEGLHEGELEALALVKEDRVRGALLCTGDAVAIQALAMIGHSESGISMARMLLSMGLQRNLDKQFTEEFFQACLAQGKENLITGRGLRKK